MYDTMIRWRERLTIETKIRYPVADTSTPYNKARY